MPLLHPHHHYQSLCAIPVERLRALGIRLVLLDIDNTLTTHDAQNVSPAILAWLAEAKAAGLALCLVSNNTAERVAPFAVLVGLPFVAKGKKPLTIGLREACRRFGTAPKHTAVIGDQIFTDVLGGRLLGARTFLVVPIEPERSLFFRMKRALERPLLYGSLPLQHNNKGGRHG